ncbi:SEL1-like repeat protein [Acinetobacter larvae]|uniref:Sel1 repeat family protein n=1 Tax=Acinetobacter larvae TaxID=1789224 RepID=A0A1B2M2B3_9GAMM|nr:SEL1-like repeat protein [Acinetobacter larvae]AOA59309.1 hypothetical protein BFG52_13725 [Acinetobacter larvae]
MRYIFLALSILGSTACSPNTSDVKKEQSEQNASNISQQKNDDYFDTAVQLLTQGGVENVTLAIKALEQSATQGNSEALYNLGTIYHYGKAGTIDYKKALDYYLLTCC